MDIRLVDENTWIFPDTVPTAEENAEILLARNGHAGLQVWTDKQSDKIKAEVSMPSGIGVKIYQMLPTYVEENSGPKLYTTTNYDEVKEFVTHKAPFEVYDITVPLTEDVLRGTDTLDASLERGSVILFLRFEAEKDMPPIQGKINMRFTIDGETAETEVPLEVAKACIPEPSKDGFAVINWLKPEELCALHNVESDSPEFWRIVDSYLDNQLELRTNHLMLPAGVPIRDENGNVTGFDFTVCRKMGEMALKKGFHYVYGGFVAHWIEWEDEEIMLLWDRSVGVMTREGYRQLKMYFTELWNMVVSMNWQDFWMQCMVDEPQFKNSAAYRILSDICRKCMPGVTIHDPVETYDIPGATDIWCLKQAQFDQYRDVWKELQAMGERFTVYTCGFPAGKVMNRSTDLPLLAGRLPFWICAKEHFVGFLHWGYNAWGKTDPVKRNCFYHAKDNVSFPPGDGFIVYPGKEGPINSLRAQIQLFGAEDCELLRQLNDENIKELCDQVCSDFDNYTTDIKVFNQTRKRLMHSIG